MNRSIFYNLSPTAEELYVERANSLFMEMLVLDRSCPGVIQESLNGRADFNELSFQISFAGKIPSQPYPVEPITLLEAIKLRLDYEHDDIERKCRDSGHEEFKHRNESGRERDKDKDRDRDRDKEKDRDRYKDRDRDKDRDKDKKEGKQGMYYYNEEKRQGREFEKTDLTFSRRSVAGCNTTPITIEDIDRHFLVKNKSEVNDAVCAYLKAKTEVAADEGSSVSGFTIFK